tara:strand:+ start:125 stop:475 length:351 start_codon:yes stop_codon:yes gene_type:complete
MRFLLSAIILFTLSACATIMNDDNVPVTLSFSDGSTGTCTLKNKRVTLSAEIPSTQMVRRSDDNLQYNCTSSNGATGVGLIPSSMGSTSYLELGIVDAITDKHRTYPASFVVPMIK